LKPAAVAPGNGVAGRSSSAAIPAGIGVSIWNLCAQIPRCNQLDRKLGPKEKIVGMPDIGMANWFLQRSLRSPERIAITFEGRDLTYQQVQAEVEKLAGRLHRLGVQRGDRVAFLGLNQPFFFFVMFATARLGAIYVPLNFRLSGPELVAIVADAEVGLLIADDEHREIIATVRADMGSVKHFVSEKGPAGWESLEDGEDSASEAVRVDQDEVAMLMYTSGTTGRAKGVMLTHGNFWWNNSNQMHAFDVLTGDVTLAVAPLFHMGGLNAIVLVVLQKGGRVVLHRNFDAAAALADIQRYKVTTMFGVPAMFQLMAQQPDFDAVDLSSIRFLICGGAPCAEPLLKIWDRRGVAIQQGYGMTETSPTVTMLTPEFALSKLGSSGRTPLFTEVRLIAIDGQPITEPRVQGEILTRGPNVMLGYWRNPEATAAAIDEDGWLRTGDIGWMDEEGFLTISDRVKDMIISGGENVYPAEIENVIFDHPSVVDAAVIGVPDPKWGETICAVLTLKEGHSVDIDGLRDFLEKRLARYKLPRRLEVFAALPRTATGKILKSELRKLIQ
jgi:fatty-acyl-CoA synthase